MTLVRYPKVPTMNSSPHAAAASKRCWLSTSSRPIPVPAPRMSTSSVMIIGQRRRDAYAEHDSGRSDGRITLRHRCAGESPMVRDISSRTAGMERMAVAVFSRIGHETIRATTATPLIRVGPSSRTATGTSAAPGMAAMKSIVGVRARSMRRDEPIAMPTAPPTTTANTRPSTYVPSVCSDRGDNRPVAVHARDGLEPFVRRGKRQRVIGCRQLPHDQQRRRSAAVRAVP